MSLMCDCVECGGNEHYVICENKLLEAWVQAYGKKSIVPKSSSLTEICHVAKKTESSISDQKNHYKKITFSAILFALLLLIFI